MAAWDSHVFVGNNQTRGFVTVEKDWHLSTIGVMPFSTSTVWPTPDRTGPWRTYQKSVMDKGLQTEVPQVKEFQIDRSVDTDAASCTITLYNSRPSTGYGTAEWIEPGFFDYNRGQAADAQARWGHVANEWSNVLTPMALIRTYEGFGPIAYDWYDSHTLGHTAVTGTWFVDKVSVGTDGLLRLQCRDAAKLLIEQLIYPPLIPASISPLKYYRWKDTTYTAIWDPGAGLGPKGSGSIPVTFANSSMDVLKGNVAFGFALSGGVNVLGQPSSYAADGTEGNYSLGHGFPASTSATVDWWEISVNAQINRVYVSPWGGGYQCYISVMEGGIWQDENAGATIPYTAGSTAGGDVTGDSIAGITYSISTGLSFETPATLDLPRTYTAQRLRVTLRAMPVGGGFTSADTDYRSGMREIAVGLSNLTSAPNSLAMARYYLNGYWVIGANGQVFSFGQAPDPNNVPAMADHNPGITQHIIAAEGHPSADGFWTLEQGGKVHAYGASQFYGDASTVGVTDFVDIGVTNTGNGYWLLRSSGGVYTYGDAGYLIGTFMGSSTTGELPSGGSGTDITRTASAICGHPTGAGYWITDYKGRVGNFGVAVNYGEITPPLPASGYPGAIECTSDGTGYWILWGNGQIFNYGSAGVPLALGGSAPGFIGGAFTSNSLTGIWTDIVRTNVPVVGATQGLWGLRADSLVAEWNATPFGSPGSSVATTRTDGNYKDYLDIVKDLLGWAGFCLTTTTFEGVFINGINGTLETTGVYSEEPLDEAIFDKKPIMDAIRTIKEIVGYQTWVDETGGFHFQAPNWWAPGNFYEDGTRVSFIPEIDENLQLFDYSFTFDDTSLRSEITIANQLPTPDNKGVIVTKYIPPGQNLLRGMIRPAIWSNEVFNRPAEQQIMAELIGMHIWFSQRQGTVTCVANPCIQINDQIRIWEKTTSESYIHYVRGVSTHHNLDTGEYVMTITTHWLGSDTNWVIGSGGTLNTNQNDTITITAPTVAFLNGTGSAAVHAATL